MAINYTIITSCPASDDALQQKLMDEMGFGLYINEHTNFPFLGLVGLSVYVFRAYGLREGDIEGAAVVDYNARFGELPTAMIVTRPKGDMINDAKAGQIMDIIMRLSDDNCIAITDDFEVIAQRDGNRVLINTELERMMQPEFIDFLSFPTVRADLGLLEDTQWTVRKSG